MSRRSAGELRAPRRPHAVGSARAAWHTLLVLLALAAPAEAQVPAWKLAQAPSPPGPRSWHAAAFDDITQRVILQGGQNGPMIWDTTYAWTGTTWVPVGDPGSSNDPGRRYAAAMANDRTRHRVVLFGGRDDVQLLGDTYEWNGVTWMRVATGGPSPRFAHTLAFDLFLQRVVLFGGLDVNGVVQNDTWVWNGNSWTQLFGGPPPPSRLVHGMSSTPGGLVLFGGLSPTFTPLNDTWELIGGTWMQRCIAPPCQNLPQQRQATAMTLHESYGKPVLVAGRDAAQMPMLDSWFWDATNWLPGAALSVARSYSTLTYDPVRQRSVLYGGLGAGQTLDDTLELYFNGVPCSDGSQCGSGFCVDGICCQDQCTGKCRRCDLPDFQGIKDGMCRQTPNGSDPDGECPAPGAPACAGVCDGSGGCAFPDNKRVCSLCTACDGQGHCNKMPFGQDDPACPPAGCSLASNQCRTYADRKTNISRCLEIGQCGWRWSQCTDFTNQPDGTKCNAGHPPVEAECKGGFCDFYH